MEAGGIGPESLLSTWPIGDEYGIRAQPDHRVPRSFVCDTIGIASDPGTLTQHMDNL